MNKHSNSRIVVFFNLTYLPNAGQVNDIDTAEVERPYDHIQDITNMRYLLKDKTASQIVIASDLMQERIFGRELKEVFVTHFGFPEEDWNAGQIYQRVSYSNENRVTLLPGDIVLNFKVRSAYELLAKGKTLSPSNLFFIEKWIVRAHTLPFWAREKVKGYNQELTIKISPDVYAAVCTKEEYIKVNPWDYDPVYLNEVYIIQKSKPSEKVFTLKTGAPWGFDIEIVSLRKSRSGKSLIIKTVNSDWIGPEDDGFFEDHIIPLANIVS